MFESVVLSIIRQAALMTKVQQEEFISKIAEALATVIKSSEPQIDDELIRAIGLPIASAIAERLKALV